MPTPATGRRLGHVCGNHSAGRPANSDRVALSTRAGDHKSGRRAPGLERVVGVCALSARHEPRPLLAVALAAAILGGILVDWTPRSWRITVAIAALTIVAGLW